MKKKRISLYVDAELYERFMSYVKVANDTASAIFEAKMLKWLEENEPYIKDQLTKGLYQYPGGMS